MNYELRVTETNNKAAKYIYEVVDESGKIITTRKSNRVYVACTINGQYFFGRLDLIGKGDHGRQLKKNAGFDWVVNKRGEYKLVEGQREPVEPTPIAYKK